MMNQFTDNTPGVPSTFNAVLDSYFPNLDQSFLPFPEKIITLADGENYTHNVNDGNAIIEAGNGSVVTFSGGTQDSTRRSVVVTGDSYEIDASGITHTHTRNAVVMVCFQQGWRNLATSTSALDQDLADLPVTAQRTSLAQAVLDSASSWIAQERRSHFAMRTAALRDAYAHILDRNVLGSTRPFKTSFVLSTAGTVATLQPDRAGIVQRIEVPASTTITSCDISLASFTTSFDGDANTRSCPVLIDAGHAPSRPINFTSIPAGLSWAPGADPVTIAKTAVGLTTHNFPFFYIEQIDSELFFRPCVISPV